MTASRAGSPVEPPDATVNIYTKPATALAAACTAACTRDRRRPCHATDYAARVTGTWISVMYDSSS
jgi:hypothetical protein